MHNTSRQSFVLVLLSCLGTIAVCMSQPYWPLILLHYLNVPAHLVPIWSACLYAAPALMTILAAPYWGKLSDRYGYRLMVVRSSLGLVTIQFLLSFCHSPLTMLLCRLAQGVCGGFIASAEAFGLRLVKPSQQPVIISHIQSAVALGTMLGPLLGGVIAHWFSYQVLFWCSSAVFVLVVLLTIIFLDEPSYRPKPQVAIQQKNSAKASAAVKLTYIAIGFAQLSRMLLVPVFALFIINILQGTTLQVGLLFAASGIALCIFSPLWAKWQVKLNHQQRSPFHLTAVMLAISGVIQLLFLGVHSLSLAFVLRFFWGAVLAGILPLLFSALVSIQQKSSYGMTSGYATSAKKVGNLCGIFLGGLIAHWEGIAMVFELMSVCYFMTFVIVAVANRLRTASIDWEATLGEVNHLDVGDKS